MESTKMLQAFLDDKKAWEMFIQGRAGTGKTTELKHIVQYLIDNNIDYLVCAFTHKACGVLASKLPENANIKTLHAYLKKRPGINEHALKSEHVDVRTRSGASERPTIVIIDEFSMVGERDYVDLLEMQDPHDDTDLVQIKTLYVGDPYQLPPVGDMQTIKPKKPYLLELAKVYRTDHQDLLDAMTKLIDMLNGADLEPIRSSENLIRGQDLVKSYIASTSTDKVCLAWTNKAVQDLNMRIAGKTYPDPGDKLFCPTTRHELVYEGMPEDIDMILTPTGYLPLNTKYKTLEFLLGLDFISWVKVFNETLHEEHVFACIFGHYRYRQTVNDLTQAAVDANNRIKAQGTDEPAQWARANPTSPLTKQRSQAWRRLLAFKEAVVCVDFPYAMTVHKSQGSTYDEVFLDSEDLSECSLKSITTYLKLFYVAISRASKRVTTN